jgi:lysosomal alpha-mannosidase
MEFTFSWYCADPPIMDDRRMHDYNVDERVDLFIKESLEQQKKYSTNHIINTMGSDFQYFDARVWYKNLDKLIKYVNMRQSTGSKVNIFYSTPSCYLYALNRANKTWTTKSDDFFPYASDPHAYWTGYFTSRPAIKRYAFEANSLLQVVKQLDVLSQLDRRHSSLFKINFLRRALGVLQHHDAISGTEKQHVAFDYAMRLSEAIVRVRGVVNHAIMKLMNKSTSGNLGTKTSSPPTPLPQMFCPHLNLSQCLTSSNYDLFTVTAYNPLLWRLASSWIRLPVVAPQGTNFQVLDADGTDVAWQLNQISQGQGVQR